MMHSSLLRHMLGLVVVMVAAGPPPAWADLHVIESTAAAIKARSQLADGDTLTIPAGAYIRVVLPSGKTQTIKGPYKGTVAELARGQPRNEGVLAWLREFLNTGGATEATPGATRSIGRESAKPRTHNRGDNGNHESQERKKPSDRSNIHDFPKLAHERLSLRLRNRSGWRSLRLAPSR